MNDSHDVIVTGSGAGGGTLAQRMAPVRQGVGTKKPR
jgi:choline dehydrogenase-like flavoprotein